MYEIFIKEVQLPVAPAQIKINTPTRNKTINLINDGEASLLKNPGLREISFEVLLPNLEYPFAQYPNNKFENAQAYLKLFKSLKDEKEIFQLKINRMLPSNKVLYDDDITVTLEDYSITDDFKEGFDCIVNLKFKEYRMFSTKKGKVVSQADASKVEVETTNNRPALNSPAPKKVDKSYTVKKGDTLWSIAKTFYGDGSKYKKIAEHNNIKNPNIISVGQKIKLPVI